MATVIAVLAFVVVTALVAGLWWVSERRQRIRKRLEHGTRIGSEGEAAFLRNGPLERGAKWGALFRWMSIYPRVATLIEQAGQKAAASDYLLAMSAFALVGGVAGSVRTGGALGGLLAALLAGSLPVFYLLYKRRQRVRRFERQFPEALDMLNRAIRAGSALSRAIQFVGEEMPAPVGEDFRRVAEEVRLGLDPDEAFAGLQRRVPAEEVEFFCSALRIHRGAGGNLAELLDRLSEVIRERFKLLSHARALSAQHRWSAICVGLSPAIFAIFFQFVSPGYLGPLLTSKIGPTLIATGLLMEAIGFFMVWRIAQIRV